MSAPRLPSRPHAWQGGRGGAALNPDAFRIDERELVDLIAFTASLSRKLPFRGANGDWSPFFVGDGKTIAGDISFLLADMARVDTAREYQTRVGRLRADDDLALEDVYAAFVRLDRWLSSVQIAGAGKVADSVARQFGAVMRALVAGDDPPSGARLPELLGDLKLNNKREWARAAARLGGLSSDVWQIDPPADDFGSQGYSNLQIYGLANRTTREIAKQARVFLAPSLAEPDHEPHAALMLAFLQLYQGVQADLNGMTRRHLNFYYRDILKLTPRPARPDQAHVCFTLAPGAKSVVLPRGVELKGGVDAKGRQIVYALDQEARLSEASIVRLASLWVERERETGEVVSILARPNANTPDGLNAQPTAGVSWSPFGRGLDPAALAPAAAANAEFGVLIRSPLLLMRAGSRRIKATLQFSTAAELAQRLSQYFAHTRAQLAPATAAALSDDEILAAAFRLVLQDVGPEREIAFTLDLTQAQSGRVAFVATLTPSDPPLLPPAGGAAVLPGLRLALRPAGATIVYGYGCFAGVALQSVDIEVGAESVAPLFVQGPSGIVDGGKPFSPFGPQASVGSGFVFSHPDLFGKPIDHLTFQLNWSGLPMAPQTLESVYAAYDPKLTRESFRARVSRLGDRAWIDLASDAAAAADDLSFPLFDPAPQGLAPTLRRGFDLSGKILTASLDDAASFGPATAAGYYRLQLTSPPIGFGQQIYPQILVAAAQKRTAPPWPPLQLTVASISVAYSARRRLDLSGLAGAIDSGQDEGVFPFAPFGAPASADAVTPFPLWTQEGLLMLGIANLDEAGEVSLLFHLAALEADVVVSERRPEGDGEPTPVLRYLAARDWKDLPATAVSLNTTFGFQGSGLLRLAFPADAQRDGNGLVWLQIAADQPELFAEVYDIRCGGASATRSTTLAAGEAAQPAGSIASLIKPNGKIASVAQPFATEAGVAAEDEAQFRIRVSERLRHKQRAVTPHDYETLILDAFPDVGDAKCLTAREARQFGAKPGEVVVVVAPWRGAAQVGDQPKLPSWRLDEIGACLLQGSSGAIPAIVVRNPAYERVRFSAWFDFAPGDRSVYWRIVRKVIDDAIAPWRNDPNAPMTMGGFAVDLASIRASLEGLDFVRGVTRLSLVKFFDDPLPLTPRAASGDGFVRLIDTAVSPAAARAVACRWPWSVLTPAPDHQLHLRGASAGIDALAVGDDLIVADAYGREAAPAQKAGVGNLAIGLDFITQAGIDHAQVGEDFHVG